MHAAEPVFDRAAIEDLELPHGLNAVATCLAEHGMPLHALPPLAMLKHLATDAACDAAHSAAADALALDALTPLSQLGHAVALLGSALAGLDLPPNAMQLPHASAPADAGAPPLATPPPTPVAARDHGPRGDALPLGRRGRPRVGRRLSAARNRGPRGDASLLGPWGDALPPGSQSTYKGGRVRRPSTHELVLVRTRIRAAACAARARASSCSCVHV